MSKNRTWVERITIGFNYIGLNTEKPTFITFVNRLYTLPHFADSRVWEGHGTITVEFTADDGRLQPPWRYKAMVERCWQWREVSDEMWQKVLVYEQEHLE